MIDSVADRLDTGFVAHCLLLPGRFSYQPDAESKHRAVRRSHSAMTGWIVSLGGTTRRALVRMTNWTEVRYSLKRDYLTSSVRFSVPDPVRGSISRSRSRSAGLPGALRAGLSLETAGSSGKTASAKR